MGALGNPLRFILTGGEMHDIAQAYALIDGLESDYAMRIGIMTPMSFGGAGIYAGDAAAPDRKRVLEYDERLFGERHLAERFISGAKQYPVS